MSTELVCSFDRCTEPPSAESGVLCQHHYDIVNRVVPERLHKRDGAILDAGHLNDDELRAIALQVGRDALPLFLVAWQWCGINALRNALPRPA